MPRGAIGPGGVLPSSGGTPKSPLVILYLALLILGRRGVKILKRDVKGLSRLSRGLQSQVALRFWLLGPYYVLFKKYLASQTRRNAPTMRSSKRNVQKVMDNYKAYSGVFALLGSVSGSNMSGSNFWPFGNSGNGDKSHASNGRVRGSTTAADDSSGGQSPVPGIMLKCPTCVQRELEDELEREFASMDFDEPVPMAYFANASSEFPKSISRVANTNAYLGDIVSSSDEKAPISAGFYRLDPGAQQIQEYTCPVVKFIVSGSFDVSDETGKKVRGAAGDVFHFPKGSRITFTTDEGGLAFYTGQRSLLQHQKTSRIRLTHEESHHPIRG